MLAQRSLIALGVAVALSVMPTLASAQGWLADRDRAEGPGIRLGDFELHPGLGIELGYDSNLYYSSDDGMSPVARRDSGILRVTPHLLFSTVGPERTAEGEGQGGDPPVVQFRGGLSGSYYEFFNDETRRNFSIDAGLRLTVLPERPFSFTVYDEFSRAIRPFTENTVSGASTARIDNSAGIDFNFMTDGGVLQVRLGYRFGLGFFESDQFAYANSFDHDVSLQETFRFLPQTALVHDTRVSYRDYYQSAGGGVLLNDSVRLRTRLGLNGAITPELSLMVMAGYAAGFFDATATYDQDYDAFVAQAQLTWRITEDVRLTLGYDRDAFAGYIGNYYTQDRGQASFQMLLFGSFLLGIDASVGYLDYGQIVDRAGMPISADGSTERTDIRVTASLFAEYRFTEWLGINGQLQYTGDFTDFRYAVLVAGTPIPDPAGYNKFEAWLGVRVFY